VIDWVVNGFRGQVYCVVNFAMRAIDFCEVLVSWVLVVELVRMRGALRFGWREFLDRFPARD
jgi:hypothetical protein